MSSSSSGGSIEPAFQFATVVPSDTVELAYTNSSGEVETKRCKAIFVGVAGNVAIKDDAGNAVTFTGCLAGAVYPLSTQVVMATNTTATNLVALY